MHQSIYNILTSEKRAQKIKSFLEFHENYFGFPINFPYIMIKGKEEGPKGVILSGIHGDELNGLLIIQRIVELIDPEHLAGDLVFLPIVNIPAFNIHSRYLPDRRDLNRLFPGNQDGSEGRRLAGMIWQTFIRESDFGIDLHSASYNRWNYPHIRGDMRNANVREMTSLFGADIAMHSKGVLGSLRREAGKVDIPFILFEAGQINRFERSIVDIGVRGIWNVLERRGMLKHRPRSVVPAPATETYYAKSHWVRASAGGLFIPAATPGDQIGEGHLLGDIQSILGESVANVRTDKSGAIIGMSLHPQVVPGRALYNIAYESKPL